MQSAFLTGTSLKVLPIRQAGQFRFSVSSNLLRFLLDKYDQKIEGNIKARKKR